MLDHINAAQDPPAFPEYIEVVIADIAALFHWTPDDMASMTLRELMQWRELARERSQVTNET